MLHFQKKKFHNSTTHKIKQLAIKKRVEFVVKLDFCGTLKNSTTNTTKKHLAKYFI